MEMENKGQMRGKLWETGEIREPNAESRARPWVYKKRGTGVEESRMIRLVIWVNGYAVDLLW